MEELAQHAIGLAQRWGGAVLHPGAALSDPSREERRDRDGQNDFSELSNEADALS